MKYCGPCGSYPEARILSVSPLSCRHVLPAVMKPGCNEHLRRVVLAPVTYGQNRTKEWAIDEMEIMDTAVGGFTELKIASVMSRYP